MSSRIGSYARIVDRMAVGKTANENKSRAKSKPSPPSAKESFRGGAKGNKQAKAARAVHRFAEQKPEPHRAPRPKGMGEKAIDRNAHYARAKATKAHARLIQQNLKREANDIQR